MPSGALAAVGAAVETVLYGAQEAREAVATIFLIGLFLGVLVGFHIQRYLPGGSGALPTVSG